MANNIVLKTYKGGNVTPQDDAIIHETAIPVNGIFKGCEVSHARGNVLRVSQGFGMIKGRFFEVYETEIAVQLADAGVTLDGRLYIHMDLSNVDEPIMILSAVASELPSLDADGDVNYNNSSFDVELATFNVSSSQISNLTQTFVTIEPGSGGSGGGGKSLRRDTFYNVGDTATVGTAPGWVTLYCTQAGTTAAALPTTYATIKTIGDSILDGTCVFEARNIIGELTEVKQSVKTLQTDCEALDKKVDDSVVELNAKIDEALSSGGDISTQIMSITDYKALSTYDENCIYFCYENANTQKITQIFFGENTLFFEGINVTYQVDAGNSQTLFLSSGTDAVAEAPTVTKSGYTFTGWRQDSSATGEVLSKYMITKTEEVILYAVFEREITVSMYPNGGTLKEGATESNMKTSLYYNNGNAGSLGLAMPKCPYEKEAMSFIGWECEGVLVKPGENAYFTESAYILPTWIDTVYDFEKVGNSTYTYFKIPADGIYEFEVWGAQGGTAKKSDVVGEGGLGGHAKGYRKMTKDEVVYVCNGVCPGTSNNGGYNGGGNGSSYSNSGTGGGGGGATSVMYRSSEICSTSSQSQSMYKSRKEDIIIIAGGGGAGGVTSSSVANKGGAGGGDHGGDGSDGAMGGRQVSTGSSEYYNFGHGGEVSSTSSSTYSGGGGGYFGGEYDRSGASGAGGSGYVGGVAPFVHDSVYYPTLNEAGVNEGNGYAFIRYVTVC